MVAIINIFFIDKLKYVYMGMDTKVHSKMVVINTFFIDKLKYLHGYRRIQKSIPKTNLSIYANQSFWSSMTCFESKSNNYRICYLTVNSIYM